jgi:signal transduction histidine kinase
MRERAMHVGGWLTVTSSPTGGTEVRLDIPLPEGTA